MNILVLILAVANGIVHTGIYLKNKNDPSKGWLDGMIQVWLFTLIIAIEILVD